MRTFLLLLVLATPAPAAPPASMPATTRLADMESLLDGIRVAMLLAVTMLNGLAKRLPGYEVRPVCGNN